MFGLSIVTEMARDTSEIKEKVQESEEKVHTLKQSLGEVREDVLEVKLKLDFVTEKLGEAIDDMCDKNKALLENVTSVRNFQTTILLTLLGSLMAFMGTAFLQWFKPNTATTIPASRDNIKEVIFIQKL